VSEQPQNIVQASGAVATSIVDGLKSQPSLLLILILNLGVFALVAWGAYYNNERRFKREMLLIERCVPAPTKGDHSSTNEVQTTGGTDATRP
jgi:hypothetical protein